VPKSKHNIAQIGIRSFMIFVMAGIGIAVPDLEPFISLVGAVFFSTLGKMQTWWPTNEVFNTKISFSGLFVPCLVEAIFQYPNYGPGNWRLWKNVILMIFAIFALISGTFVSVKDIVKLYTGEGH
jgi:solute carrier family 36 (proton-coupled amino acid transporter)